jgi:DNA-binding CsgD family transcriptional regulator
MSEPMANNVFVLLSDWRGRIVWTSSGEVVTRIGELAWTHLNPASQDRAKECHGRVVGLRETQTLRVETDQGKHLRCWMWPLDSPEVAVCILGREVPAALSQLSDREMECLEMLAQGVETKEIADRLDLSLSTVHTHLKRAREKLDLPGVEALISFAARFCYPTSAPFSGERSP